MPSHASSRSFELTTTAFSHLTRGLVCFFCSITCFTVSNHSLAEDPAAGGLLNDLLKELKEFRTDQKEANDEQKKFNDEQKKFNDQLLPLIFADSAILRKVRPFHARPKDIVQG